MAAAEALAAAGIAPVNLMAKAGLSTVNGTALSAGVGSLAIWDSHQLAVLAQLLNCMDVGALCGTDENFERGQQYISFLRVQSWSTLTTTKAISCTRIGFRYCDPTTDLRYALRSKQLWGRRYGVVSKKVFQIRTSSQWSGPVLEDLVLTYQQVEIELNSVSDNAVIDRESGRVLHGGNFQAKALT